MNFYTISALGLVGAIIAFSIISFYYNTKYVPMRNKRGVAAQPLTRLANQMFKNGYKSKEPFSWLSNKRFESIPYKTKKLFSLRNFNLLLNLITIALIAIQNENWWLVPVIQTIINIIAYAPKHQARNAIITKMCVAAHKKLGWGPTALLRPWAYVKVAEWDGNTPSKVTLTLNTDFDATNPATKDNFERHFDSVVSDRNNWSYEWSTAEGSITIIPVALLPEMAAYEGSENLPWNEFAVGEGINGPVTYDIQKYPHVLVGGTTGSGKSVLQRNIIFHCIQHNYMWRFLGVDLKRVELGPFKKYETTVMGIASELEDGVEIVRYAQRVMNTRYTQMEEAGVNHFKNLIDPKTGKTKERALLIMVDEAAMFMGTENVKTDEGKARDELHGEAVGIIGALARLGRAAGIHLLLATQRPDATFIPGETKNNLDVRIAAGRLDSTPSMMILDSGAATMLPGHIKGRGVIRYAGHNQEFQGYYAEPEWIDKWLEEHPGVEPSLFPAEGQVTDSQLNELPQDLDFEDGILSLEADVMSPDLAEFAESVEEALDEDDNEELDELPRKGEKKKLFGKKNKKDTAAESTADEESSPEPDVEEAGEPFLNMDDEEDSGSLAELPRKKPAEQEQPQSEPKSELTPAEEAILQKMKQTFGKEAVEEQLGQHNPLKDFEVEESGIPAFNIEEEPLEDTSPTLAEPEPKPDQEKSAPAFPAPVSNPAAKAFPAPKGFPPPPAGANKTGMPLPPPPKGFPPPPKKPN